MYFMNIAALENSANGARASSLYEGPGNTPDAVHARRVQIARVHV
jgi:hypothetical protein